MNQKGRWRIAKIGSVLVAQMALANGEQNPRYFVSNESQTQFNCARMPKHHIDLHLHRRDDGDGNLVPKSLVVSSRDLKQFQERCDHMLVAEIRFQ